MKAINGFVCRYILCTVWAISIFNTVKAQDTLRITMQQADQQFLDRNLQLLAGTLNIAMQEAAELQARLYPNPVISAQINAIDPENDRLLHVGKTGQQAVAIEQLILLGGKRKAEIALARQAASIARLELADLLRELRLQLHTSLYTVYFDQLTVKKYNAQLKLLDTLIQSYERQAKKGNVAYKEVVRLKSGFLALNNDRSEILQNIEAQQKNLRLLLQTAAYTVLVIDTTDLKRFAALPSLDTLNFLSQNRADLRLAQADIMTGNLNLRYQKKVAVPDATLGAEYDKMGGAFNNQVNLTLGLPLPVWNRNQGNILAAKTQIKAAEVNRQIRQSEVTAEVFQAWANMARSIREYEQSQRFYNDDFAAVSEGMADNFRRQNISIMEFVDFFESYNQSVAEINRIRKQLLLSAEGINYATGYPVFQ